MGGLPKSEALLHHVPFALVALVGAVLLTFGLVAGPGYTDAFYHANAAARLAAGHGFTDPYLWTYVGLPDSLPAPSHLYWMPLTAVVGAAGMALAGAPGSYAAAQLPFALLFAGTVLTGYGLGGRIGGTMRHAWLAGLLTLFSGYFTRFWGATDTFAPYALAGALALVAIGRLAERLPRGGAGRWAALAGAMAALAHLTRADGVLLLLVGVAVALWPMARVPAERRARALALLVVTYALVMLPWFARNLSVAGVLLPTGGADALWFADYNDLFRYPPGVSAQEFFSGGLARLASTRAEALVNNLASFVGVEGLIVLTPLMLVGLWRRRALPFLRGLWLYAVGLHLVMTLVFPLPGYRGGLFHSAAALVPWWAALGAAGLDDVLAWAARRRGWRLASARPVFGAALVLFAVGFSLWIGLGGRAPGGEPPLYGALARALPPGARVMINDPAQLYYFTGFGGVVLPQAKPDVLPEIARRYGVGYLLLEGPHATPAPLLSLYDAPPAFLTPVPLDVPGVWLYAIAA